MLRNRVHICALKAYKGILLLNQMRYEEQLREIPEIEARTEKITAKETELATKLIHQLTEKFNPAAFKDTYASN
jgi:DNA end-binding protein Ku